MKDLVQKFKILFFIDHLSFLFNYIKIKVLEIVFNHSSDIGFVTFIQKYKHF